MTGIKEATVVICFEMGGVSIEMTGQASIVEKFGKEMRQHFLYITLERPTIEEVEPPLEMIAIDDSSHEGLKTIGGSLMAMDDDGEPKRGLKRQREEDSDDEDPLILKHTKKIKTGTILETLRNLEDPERRVYEDVQYGIWGGERPSDPYAEIWEEIWDEELVRAFREYDWA